MYICLCIHIRCFKDTNVYVFPRRSVRVWDATSLEQRLYLQVLPRLSLHNALPGQRGFKSSFTHTRRQLSKLVSRMGNWIFT